MSATPPPDSPPAAPGTFVLKFPQEEDVGQRIGRYKLLQKLGEGGCGVVFMAEQEEPVKRRVALKVIKLGMDTRQVVARFEAERQALAMMDHPNIARVLDAGATDNGRPFFVMELVRGIRVTDYCDQNKLAARERLELFIQICSAIQHAHQKGIIHRDIKPSNILVTLHDGVPVPKVIDFGIAKATHQQLTDKTLFTELQQFIGTPAYMSPEQAELSGLDIDTRSDIYSLGVLLYELLTGRTPFDPKDLAKAGLDEIRRRIREEEPARPSTRLSTLAAAELTDVAAHRHAAAPELLGLLRGDLDWIVMRCLEKDRTRRYETANGLAMDIKRFLAHEPVAARPPSTSYRLQKFARRHKVGLAASVGVAAAVVLGFIVSTWSFLQERRARARAESAEKAQTELRREAESARATAEEQRELANTQRARAEEHAFATRRALYAADMNLAQAALKANNLGRARRLLDRHRPEQADAGAGLDLRDWEWRYLWQQCQSGAIHLFTNRPTRVLAVALSHDNALLAAGYYDGWVGIWDFASRKLLHSFQTEGTVGFLAFSPKDRKLLLAGPGGIVRLFDTNTRTERALSFKESIQIVTSIAFSRDGNRIAAFGMVTGANGALQVWDSQSGESLQAIDLPFRGGLHQGRIDFSADGETVFVGGFGTSFEARRVSDGTQVFRKEGASAGSLTAIAVSPNGQFVLTAYGFSDSAIRVWRASDGEPVATLEGHTGWVADLDFSPDGQRLVSGSADQTIRLWDTAAWKEIAVLRGHGDELHAVAFSTDGRRLVSGAKDGDILLWDAANPGMRSGNFIFPERVDGANLLPDGRRLLTLKRGAPPSLFDLRTRQQNSLPLPPNGITSFSEPDSIFHYDQEKWLILYQITGNGLKEIRRDEVGPRFQGGDYYAAKGLLAVSHRGTNRFEVMNVKAGTVRRTFISPNATPVSPIWFVDEGRHLFAIGDDALAQIWNVERGEPVPLPKPLMVINVYRNLTFTRGPVFGVLSFSQEERRFYLNFFDFRKSPLAPISVPIVGEPPGSLALSHDDKWLAYGTPTGKAAIHDTATGEAVRLLHGHMNSVSDVTFSFDSKRLATSSGVREAVKLWDVATGLEVLNLESEGFLLGSVDFSADSNTILAAPRQNNSFAHLWTAPSWEQIAASESAGLWKTQIDTAAPNRQN